MVSIFRLMYYYSVLPYHCTILLLFSVNNGTSELEENNLSSKVFHIQLLKQLKTHYSLSYIFASLAMATFRESSEASGLDEYFDAVESQQDDPDSSISTPRPSCYPVSITPSPPPPNRSLCPTPIAAPPIAAPQHLPSPSQPSYNSSPIKASIQASPQVPMSCDSPVRGYTQSPTPIPLSYNSPRREYTPSPTPIPMSHVSPAPDTDPYHVTPMSYDSPMRKPKADSSAISVNSCKPPVLAPSTFPPPMSLHPPSTTDVYDTAESLIIGVNKYAIPQGYLLRRAGLKKDKRDELRKVWLGCNKGGKYQPRVADSDRQRNRTTRRCECPWKGYALRSGGAGGTWSLVVKEGSHNHPPTKPEDQPGPRLRKARHQKLSSKRTVAMQSDGPQVQGLQ